MLFTGSDNLGDRDQTRRRRMAGRSINDMKLASNVVRHRVMFLMPGNWFTKINMQIANRPAPCVLETDHADIAVSRPRALVPVKFVLQATSRRSGGWLTCFGVSEQCSSRRYASTWRSHARRQTEEAKPADQTSCILTSNRASLEQHVFPSTESCRDSKSESWSTWWKPSLMAPQTVDAVVLYRCSCSAQTLPYALQHRWPPAWRPPSSQTRMSILGLCGHTRRRARPSTNSDVSWR
jgi:hypothetical protein